REDCGGRGATLLLPRDRDELELLNETLQKSGRSFWIGLWKPVPGTGWTWLDGSRLDRDRFQLDGTERPGDCGTLRSSRISPQDCGLQLQWICQREATKI
ncbi:KLRBC protein, partial [Machaerirhynchus nigripectus]|nr:KLRBC protein [Machaerirhynchus nigripectus]